MNQDFFNEDTSEITFSKRVKCCKCNCIYMTPDSSCLFCGSKDLKEVDDNSDLGESYLVPFNLERDDALKDYRKKLGFNPFLPGIFKKDIDKKMHKVYFVCERGDMNIKGETVFLGLDDRNKLNARYKVLNTVNFDFLNVLDGGNKKINNLLSRVLNYSFANLVEFSFDDVMDDSKIIRGAFGDDDRRSDAMKLALGMIRDNVKHDEAKLKENRLTVTKSSNQTVLVPAYVLNVFYNNKSFLYVMNGENSKSSVELCVSKIKLCLFSIIVFIVIFAASYLVVYFL